MKSREDKMIERIVNRRKNNKICTIPRASTLADVKREAVRRARVDGYDRVIYMKAGAELCIRLVGDGKSGDQTSLCHVWHSGKIVDLI
jgi:hypothetical protein